MNSIPRKFYRLIMISNLSLSNFNLWQKFMMIEFPFENQIQNNIS